MRVRVLGPVSVVDDAGVEHTIGSAHHRRLLGALGLAFPEPVSVDDLIDVIWGEDAPATAQAAVQTYVSALRKTFGRDVICTLPSGYGLDGLRTEVDACEFVTKLEAARTARSAGDATIALATVTQALGLWRGRPLADTDGMFDQAAIAQLDELRLQAFELGAELRITTGDADSAIPELRRLVATHPLRERLVELLMTALYRTGRQAEALAAYQQARRVLADELGLDPSTGLQRLEAQILAQAVDLLPAPEVTMTPDARLPGEVDGIVGRDLDVYELLDLISAGRRLVTITGTGGVGKTRLSIALGALASSQFVSTAFIRLESVTTASAALATMARALNATQRVPGNVVDVLADTLRGEHRLLILDNLEHVLDLGSAVAALLEKCPELVIVTTSRVPLKVRGERVYPLRPLALPGKPVITVPEALESPAVRLLLERAQAAAPDLALSQNNVADVAAVCAALDGLPLALELVAPRLATVSAAELARRIQSSRLVIAGGADRSTRHRTLESTIAWSYGLLSPAAQGLLRGLAIFTGGATLHAIERVFGTADEVLDELRENNVVVFDPQRDRYLMLETIRDFAARRLRENGEECEDVLRRHATYFCWLADAHPEFKPAVAVAARDKPAPADAPPVAPELGNLLAALNWAEGRDARMAMRIVETLTVLFDRTGDTVGRDQMFKRTRAMPGATEQFRVRIDLWLAISRMEAGRTVEISEMEEISRRARVIGDDGTLVECQGFVAYLQGAEGDLGKAAASAQVGVDAAERVGDDLLLARIHNMAGNVALMANDFTTARAAFELYREHSRAAGAEVDAAVALANLAELELLRGDLVAASQWLVKAQETTRRAGGHAAAECMQQGVEALILAGQGDTRGAAEVSRETLSRRLRIRYEMNCLEDVAGVAATLLVAGERAAAVTLFTACDELGQAEPMWLPAPYLRPLFDGYAAEARCVAKLDHAPAATGPLAGYELREIIALALAACDRILAAPPSASSPEPAMVG